MDAWAGDWQMLVLIFAGALAGGFVNGLARLRHRADGAAGLAPGGRARARRAACGRVLGAGHISTFPALRSAVDWRRLAPMLAAGLAGVPIGTLVLPLVSLPAFKLCIGLALAAYCSFMLLAAGRVKIAAGGPGAEVAVGFGGGVLGGLAALSGVLPTVWASLKDWPKDERRILFQAFNSTVLTAMLVTSLLSGLVGLRQAVAFAVAAPGTLAGAWLGYNVYRRLDDVRFDRIVLIVLLLSGLVLVWSSR